MRYDCISVREILKGGYKNSIAYEGYRAGFREGFMGKSYEGIFYL